MNDASGVAPVVIGSISRIAGEEYSLEKKNKKKKKKKKMMITMLTQPNKVRVVHLYAPEVIKTDAVNFRELVQRLTGKLSNNTAGSQRIASQKIRVNGEQYQTNGNYIINSCEEAAKEDVIMIKRSESEEPWDGKDDEPKSEFMSSESKIGAYAEGYFLKLG